MEGYASLLPRNSMVLPQLVRWGFNPTGSKQVPLTCRFRLCGLETGDYDAGFAVHIYIRLAYPSEIHPVLNLSLFHLDTLLPSASSTDLSCNYANAFPRALHSFSASSSGASLQVTLSHTSTASSDRQVSSQLRIHSPSPHP